MLYTLDNHNFFGKKRNPLRSKLLKNWKKINPTNIYLFKVNNSNVTKRCEICLKLTIKAPEQRH